MKQKPEILSSGPESSTFNIKSAPTNVIAE